MIDQRDTRRQHTGAQQEPAQLLRDQIPGAITDTGQQTRSAARQIAQSSGTLGLTLAAGAAVASSTGAAVLLTAELLSEQTLGRIDSDINHATRHLAPSDRELVREDVTREVRKNTSPETIRGETSNQTATGATKKGEREEVPSSNRNQSKTAGTRAEFGPEGVRIEKSYQQQTTVFGPEGTTTFSSSHRAEAFTRLKKALRTPQQER